MKRKISEELLKWKNKSFRKPLILWGARQTGKTWSLKEFGKKHFNNTVYISFYNNRRMSEIFERDYDVRRIISAIEIEMHVKISPEETLLIFDEIQGAPKVIESLKYFCEDASEYHVAAAGSLLGVAIHEGVSFPVGKVDELHLHPMSFQEFLWAMGEDRLADFLEDVHFSEINDFKDKYIELLKQYYVVGGMPEVVKNYCIDRDFDHARELQLSILSQFEGDFGKHVNANELPRIRMVWQSLPVQLAKENRKFFFGQIKKGARSKDFEIALQWLTDAGLIHKVNKVSKPALPLKSYVDLSSFKVYMLDIGLLGALAELDWRTVIMNDNAFVEFKGALTEQYVLQQLVAETGLSLYYFSSEKSAYEVDFLFSMNGKIYPLEVKAQENLKAKSLRFYYDKYKPDIALRTSMSGFRVQDWLINLPLWAIQEIDSVNLHNTV